MGYKVTDTQQIKTMTQAGGTATFYRVWIVTDRGSTGQVDVPLDNWTEGDLKTILGAEAARLDLAFNLKG